MHGYIPLPYQSQGLRSFDGASMRLVNRALARLTDAVTPTGVSLFAIWTVGVQCVSLLHGSFELVLWLAAAVLLLGGALAWWWLSSASRAARYTAVRPPSCAWRPAGLRRWMPAIATVAWVAVYAATRNYTLFWWGAVVGLAVAWVLLLRGDDEVPAALPPRLRQGWALVGLCVVAAVVALVANRPDIDDAFYLSIPATLLHDPSQPILLHDTLYRLPTLPIEFVGYREHTYEVLIGVVAWVTGLAPIVVAHIVFPPIFAVLSVLAWAWLLRMLVPLHWLPALALLVVCMLLLGETHHAYGNFGFVRIFQGKGIELCWSIPAIIGCALLWMRSGRAAAWYLLMASQIAAIGITSTGLFVAPVAAALALAAGWRPTATASRRLIVGCCASWYVVVVAGLLTAAAVHSHDWSPNYASTMAPLGDIVIQTWGMWSTLPLLVALLGAWAACESRATARVFAGMSLLFLLVCFNPYTYRFVADHVMGASALWRLSWAIPLPLMLAVMIRAILARGLVLPVPWRGWKYLVWGVAVGLTAWAAYGAGTLRAANHVTLGMPRVKAPAADYALAERLVRDMPESGTLLAPVTIASWCSTFVRHPLLLAVRPMYLMSVANELGRANAEER